MKIKPIYILAIIIVSCSKNSKVKILENGEKIVYEVNEQNIPNGKWLNYFKTGELSHSCIMMF